MGNLLVRSSRGQQPRHREYAGRVLIAGNGSDEWETHADHLRAEGICALVTASYADACRIVSEVRLSAVVVDIEAPAADDARTLMTCLEQRLRDVPVVVVTEDASSQVRAAVEHVGASRLVLKPCLPDVLSQTIVDAINRRL